MRRNRAVWYFHPSGANGAFTYKMSGVINNRSASNEDSGTVELGGEFVIFRGHAHVVRYPLPESRAGDRRLDRAHISSTRPESTYPKLHSR
jgi:hypothetical protein